MACSAGTSSSTPASDMHAPAAAALVGRLIVCDRSRDDSTEQTIDEAEARLIKMIRLNNRIVKRKAPRKRTRHAPMRHDVQHRGNGCERGCDGREELGRDCDER
eukprot:scaffold13855_cov131-Isochrysis_galbana.AAC.5